MKQPTGGTNLSDTIPAGVSNDDAKKHFKFFSQPINLGFANHAAEKRNKLMESNRRDHTRKPPAGQVQLAKASARSRTSVATTTEARATSQKHRPGAGR